MTDPAEVASRLSDAQKRALMWLKPDGKTRPGAGRDIGHALAWMRRRDMADCCEDWCRNKVWYLRPFGQAVRAAIASQQETNHD